MPSLKPISSSQLISLGWNRETRRLVAQFGEDSWYEYDNVPPEVVADLFTAESHGRAFTQLVKKGGFAFRRIGREAAYAD